MGILVLGNFKKQQFFELLIDIYLNREIDHVFNEISIFIRIILIILFMNYLWIKQSNISFTNTYLYQLTLNA